MLYFATLFDTNYLDKGLALYNSLQTHVSSFRLFVLCLDENTFLYFTQNSYANLHPLRLSALETNDVALQQARNNRSKVEYYFTLSPILPLYILSNFKDVDLVTTLDADIYFYGDPSPIFDEFKNKSILITPHRFPEKLKEKEKYGLYNVSFQIFRNDEIGLECLRWWRAKCLDWCYDRIEGNRFADQKYLDDWPARFQRVQVLQHEGAGLAPWNIDNFNISIKKGTVYSNNSPLIFYHFHYLKVVKTRWFTHGVDVYLNTMTAALKDLVYHPYINRLIRLTKELKMNGVNRHLRVNSGAAFGRKTDVLRTCSSLYNMLSIYTLEIDVRIYFKYSRKILKKIKKINLQIL